MPVFSQYGVMRILRLVVAVAFMLLLLVSFSRGEETSQVSNLTTETETLITLQDSFDYSIDQDRKCEENSVLQPNDGSEPDISGHTHPVPRVGVVEHIGATISSPIYFTDSTGKQVDIRSLMTVPVLIVPVYYACTSVCHIFLSAISGILPDVRLTPDKNYRILNVSLDASETPELAARKKNVYLKTVHQRDPSFPSDAWLFLTGSKKSIDTLMNEIGFYHRQVGKEYEHPIVVVSVSPEGKIIRYLYGVNLSPFDVTMALMEGDTSTSILSAKRIAQTCYSYDPKKKKYVISVVTIVGVMILGFVAFLAANLLFGGKRKQKM